MKCESLVWCSSRNLNSPFLFVQKVRHLKVEICRPQGKSFNFFESTFFIAVGFKRGKFIYSYCCYLDWQSLKIHSTGRYSIHNGPSSHSHPRRSWCRARDENSPQPRSARQYKSSLPLRWELHPVTCQMLPLWVQHRPFPDFRTWKLCCLQSYLYTWNLMKPNSMG